MRLSAFLYRRLAAWVTCELELPGQSRLGLRSKYEVASFGDVFCHPFYWQVFADTERDPELVLDLGAHCGHFTLMVDACLRSRGKRAGTRYVLVEPNPCLAPIIRRSISEAGLSSSVTLLQGLVGISTESATLYVHPRNYLMASLSPQPGSQPYAIPRADVESAVGDRPVDIMKMDIEGAEYAFVRQHTNLLKRVKTLFLEVHPAAGEHQRDLARALEAAGLRQQGPSLDSSGNHLQLWRRVP